MMDILKLVYKINIYDSKDYLWMLVDFMEFKRLEDMVGNIIVCQPKLTFGRIFVF